MNSFEITFYPAPGAQLQRVVIQATSWTDALRIFRAQFKGITPVNWNRLR